MPERLYTLLHPWITRIMSLWVKPAVLPEHPGTLLNPDLPVLYVLEVGGIADRAALSLVTRKFDLPRPSAPLAYAGQHEPVSLDVLKRRAGFFRKHRLANSDRLLRLVTAAATESAGELQVVPVAVYWGRAPDREASVFRLWFAEDWHIGGRTRKFFRTLLHGRHTLLSFSEPLSMRTLMESDASAPVLQRKLARVLRVHFRQRRMASLGPDQSHRHLLVNHVLADAGVRAAIQNEAQEQSLERAQRNAEKYAYEVAADVSYPTVRILQRVLTRLWTELYDGVQVDGIERLQAVADGKEIVYVPCHRSHIDYMLLSYVLYMQGFSIPHVAAGVNLNLPVVGGLLRRGGAFFLRRTFAGNKLYAAVFNAYLKEILQRGYALEYFIEGGRSRNGRLLPPKGGMLAMTVHAYLRNPRTPVVFVPVYFGYERLLEGRAFTSELAGGKKQKESVFGLIKSLRTLREDYGHVYVNIGTPINLDNLLESHRPDWREDAIETTRPEWLTPVITELGDNIMERINQAASVTPISLLATALLATPHGRLGRDDLIEQIRVYHSLLEQTHTGSNVVVPDIEPAELIPHAQQLKFIEVRNDPLGELVSIRDGQAAALIYFRNNILHLLTLPSLIACCFLNRRVRSQAAIDQLVALAYPFLQADLFMVDETSDQALQQALSAMQETGLLKETEQGWKRASAGTSESVALLRLAQTVTPTLERYYMTAALLVAAGPDGISRDTLAARCSAVAERIAQTQGRDAGDLHDKHLFNNCMLLLTDRAYVREADGLMVASETLTSIEQEARSLLNEPMRHAVLNSIRGMPLPPTSRQDSH